MIAIPKNHRPTIASTGDRLRPFSVFSVFRAVPVTLVVLPTLQPSARPAWARQPRSRSGPPRRRESPPARFSWTPWPLSPPASRRSPATAGATPGCRVFATATQRQTTRTEEQTGSLVSADQQCCCIHGHQSSARSRSLHSPRIRTANKTLVRSRSRSLLRGGRNVGPHSSVVMQHTPLRCNGSDNSHAAPFGRTPRSQLRPIPTVTNHPRNCPRPIA